MSTSFDQILLWPTDDVVMLTGTEVGIYGVHHGAALGQTLRVQIRHLDSDLYWRPDGSLGESADYIASVVDGSGHWRLLHTPMLPGSYELTVLADDDQGNNIVRTGEYTVIGEALVDLLSSNNEQIPEAESSNTTSIDLSTGTIETSPTTHQPIHKVAEIEELAAAGFILMEPGDDLGVPSSVSGERLKPLVSSDFNRPIPSTESWSSVIFSKFDDQFSAPLYLHPLQVKIDEQGFQFGAAVNRITTVTGTTTAEMKAPLRFDLDINLFSGEAAEQFILNDYGDWHFNGSWQGGQASKHQSSSLTLAQSMPIAWLEDVRIEDLAIESKIFTDISIDTNRVLLKTSDNDYALYAEDGFNWIRSGNVLTLDGQRQRSDLSIALLPETVDQVGVLRDFDALAFNRPEQTRFSIEESTSPFELSARYVSLGKQGLPLQTIWATYPHQQALIHNPELPSRDGAHYLSARGEHELQRGSDFSLVMDRRGILPALPAALNEKQRMTIKDLLADDSVVGDPVSYLNRWSDTYWSGKALLKLTQLAQVADQVGENDARDRLLDAVRNDLNDWFQADGTPGDRHFAYNSLWTTLQGYPDSFGSATDLNDHHFHYGYLIHAAALLGQFDRKWAESKKPIVNALIDDVANGDRDSQVFPYLRHFSPIEGHSWASGHAAFGSGNNQESSSEAMNFATGMALWAGLMADEERLNLASTLYSLEAEAIASYWFNREGEALPEDFPFENVGMVWGDGAAHATWFSAEPEMISGINMLPFTGGSLYLSEMAADAEALLKQIEILNGGEADQWEGLLYQFAALNDPTGSYEAYINDDVVLEDGQSAASTFYWMAVLSNLGRPEASIRSNHSFANVFRNDSGVTSYVAYNPEQDDVDVVFSDGTVLTAAPEGTTTINEDWWVEIKGNVMTSNISTSLDAKETSIKVLKLTGTKNVDAIGNAYSNKINGNAGDNRITGQNGRDVLSGRAGDDQLDGGEGKDKLKGGRGNDLLIGGFGNDRLLGGRGMDQLYGGRGADEFIYLSVRDSRNNNRSSDTINDFDPGQADQINFSRIDADQTSPGRQMFEFIGSEPFSGMAGEVRFFAGNLSLNTNNDLRADMNIELKGVVEFESDSLIL